MDAVNGGRGTKVEQQHKSKQEENEEDEEEEHEEKEEEEGCRVFLRGHLAFALTLLARVHWNTAMLCDSPSSGHMWLMLPPS